MKSFLNIVDIIAIAPFFVNLMLQVKGLFTNIDRSAMTGGLRWTYRRSKVVLYLCVIATYRMTDGGQKWSEMTYRYYL